MCICRILLDDADFYAKSDGRGYEAYGIDRVQGALVVVRPDGYIGAFVQDVDGLETYITKIVGGAAPYR